MKINKILIIGMLGSVAWGLSPTAYASIIGSKHDFSVGTNYLVNGVSFVSSSTSTNVCGACHTIHHAPDPTRGPLWIHTPSKNTFVTYDQAGSETFPSGLSVSLGSSSLACLGCHDGSVAINSQDSLSGGIISTSIKDTTPVFISSRAVVVEVSGSVDDLTHMHPIGVNYTTAAGLLAQGELNPVTTPIAGGTIANVMLKNGNVECSSCHDIHRTQGASPTSGIYTIASGQLLCLTCHNK